VGNPTVLKLERQICGVSQESLAARLGLHHTSILMYERGREPKNSSGSAYVRIRRGMRNHAAVDYYPCPTVISLAPGKWTPLLLDRMAELRWWYGRRVGGLQARVRL
jgi:transcriptional regulator with XRE-family HTH domain